MIESQLPFKVTAALAALVIALAAFLHGAIDAGLFVTIVTPLFTLVTGILTHTKTPEKTWQQMKAEEEARTKT